MERLKTTHAKVKAILEQNEDSRNDDMLLYLGVCDACVKGAGAMPFARIMAEHRQLGLPPFESVRRARQKLQADCPELAGSPLVRRRRAAQEQVYRCYAGMKNNAGEQ